MAHAPTHDGIHDDDVPEEERAARVFPGPVRRAMGCLQEAWPAILGCAGGFILLTSLLIMTLLLEPLIAALVALAGELLLRDRCRNGLTRTCRSVICSPSSRASFAPRTSMAGAFGQMHVTRWHGVGSMQ